MRQSPVLRAHALAVGASLELVEINGAPLLLPETAAVGLFCLAIATRIGATGYRRSRLSCTRGMARRAFSPTSASLARSRLQPP